MSKKQCGKCGFWFHVGAHRECPNCLAPTRNSGDETKSAFDRLWKARLALEAVRAKIRKRFPAWAGSYLLETAVEIVRRVSKHVSAPELLHARRTSVEYLAARAAYLKACRRQKQGLAARRLPFVVEINGKELWVVSAFDAEAAAQCVHKELQDTRAPFAVSVLGQVKCVLK